jgi:hypothetical protein
MKMKTRSVFAVLRVALPACLLLVPLLSCSFFGIPSYELTVTVHEGVNGSPESGTHSYEDLTVVEYAYTPVNYLHTVEVIYEGTQTSASGSLTVYTNVALEARLVDIRDVWTVTLYDANSNKLIDADVTFSGADILGGTFSDSRDLAGTWDGTSNVIKMTYSNWESYILTGTLFSMSGLWANGDASGTWSAVRKTS